MSLINQALRKAQRDRAPSRMPDAAASTAAQVAASAASDLRPGLVIGLVITVAVLLGLLLGLSLVLLNGNEPAAIPVARQEVVPPPAAHETVAAVAPPTDPPSQTQAPLEPMVQQRPAEPASLRPDRKTTSPFVEELRRAGEAAEAKAAAEATAARAAVEPDQDIIDWLARAVITAVKLSENESKVILNGDSYAVGEYVNYSLGLKVMIVQDKRVLFVDKRGKKYLKRL
ncbi:MAG: hypothetical protein ACPGIC_00045 [Opitutales bacterium]